MDWGKWSYETLLATSLPQEVKDVIYSGGSVVGDPAVKPFIVLTFGSVFPELNDDGAAVAESQTLQVWVYDDPGTYETINSILRACRDALVGQVSLPGAINCQWQGDSAELADDTYKAITRNGSFRLVGGN